MTRNQTRIHRCVLLPALLAAACRCGGGDSAADADAEGGCTFASCDLECRAAGRCYGSCSGGTCRCSTSCGDVDADAGHDDAALDDGATDDAGGAEDGEVVIERREGASPGVACRKVPSPSPDSTTQKDGQGARIVFTPVLPASYVPLVSYDWSSASARILDDLSDLPGISGTVRLAESPSLEYPRVAYGVGFFESRTRSVSWLVVLDIESGEKRIISEIAGDLDRGASAFADVQLRYPWLGWRELGEMPGVPDATYVWDAYAQNLETGQEMTLERRTPVKAFDLLGATAVASAGVIYEVDVVTDDLVQISSTPPSNGIWDGVITPDWIAWLDQRNRPECTRTSPCDTEIWGFDRRTRMEVPLVASPGMHGPDLDGEGEWLAYADQRDDPNPHEALDRRQNIYALHLPTMTEIRVEDWPGYQMKPRVYRGVDEWRVLLVEEVSYLPAAMDLWDCSLPDL